MTKLKYTVPPIAFAVVLALMPLAAAGDRRQPQNRGGGAQNPSLTQTQESQKLMTPEQALQRLKDGNRRFTDGAMVNRDLRAQISATAAGQYPFAVILSCQDSRTSSDLLFDLNKGDAFSLRIAGNVINDDILGGMEFGTKAAGAKLIAVVGHTKCGAVYGACDDVRLGHLTGLLDKIKPAIKMVPDSVEPRSSQNTKFAEMVAEANVRMVVKQIPERSPVIRELVAAGRLKVVGGMYDVSTGVVTFYGD